MDGVGGNHQPGPPKIIKPPLSLGVYDNVVVYRQGLRRSNTMTEGDSPSVGWMGESLSFDRNQSMALLLLPISLLYPSLYSKELSLHAQRVLWREWQCVGVGDQSHVIIV